jgi:hypothetical protein
MNMTRLRAIAAPLMAIGLLGACGSSGANTASPTPAPTRSTPTKTTSAAPTTVATTSTPTAPTLLVLLPSIKDYFNGYNEALATSSTSKFRKTFHRGCIKCQSEAGRLDATFRKGETYQGGDLIFSCSKVDKGLGGSVRSVVVNCLVHQKAWKVKNRSDSVVETSPASSPLAVYVQVTKIRGKFLVTGIVA